MVTNLVWLIVLITAIGLVLSFVLNRRQQKRTYDGGTNETTAKHPFLANPIVIAYVLFPVVIVIGAIILMFYS
ncbi:hypothetical protein [Paenibacillus sp. GYB003]|jgi:hypothetical protein|uniref:hypothetical protein n=1 Tax=Paenibacillus sp. GYB003 TaxID=2994392 RepID=UPI002F9660D7